MSCPLSGKMPLFLGAEQVRNRNVPCMKSTGDFVRRHVHCPVGHRHGKKVFCQPLQSPKTHARVVLRLQLALRCILAREFDSNRFCAGTFDPPYVHFLTIDRRHFPFRVALPSRSLKSRCTAESSSAFVKRKRASTQNQDY